MEIKDIQFVNGNHEFNFKECLRQFKFSMEDNYRLAFFYIMSSNYNFLIYIPKIYNLEEGRLNAENFNSYDEMLNPLSRSESTMIKLAIKLYNEMYFEDYDFIKNFDYLDSDNRLVMYQAFMLRF